MVTRVACLWSPRYDQNESESWTFIYIYETFLGLLYTLRYNGRIYVVHEIKFIRL